MKHAAPDMLAETAPERRPLDDPDMVRRAMRRVAFVFAGSLALLALLGCWMQIAGGEAMQDPDAGYGAHPK